MQVEMKAPGFQLHSASDADLDAFYALFAQMRSIHAEIKPEFSLPPEKDEAF